MFVGYWYSRPQWWGYQFRREKVATLGHRDETQILRRDPRQSPGRTGLYFSLCRSPLMTQKVSPVSWKSGGTVSQSKSGGTGTHLLLLLLMAYSSWALPCPPLIARSPDWLPSSVQTRGQYSVASNPPQLHVARYGWVQRLPFGRFQSEGGLPYLTSCKLRLYVKTGETGSQTPRGWD